jgi:hypothetical protein
MFPESKAPFKSAMIVLRKINREEDFIFHFGKANKKNSPFMFTVGVIVHLIKDCK